MNCELNEKFVVLFHYHRWNDAFKSIAQHKERNKRGNAAQIPKVTWNNIFPLYFVKEQQ